MTTLSSETGVSHHLTLADTGIHYRLIRRQRRTIELRVQDGLRVVAPPHVPLRDIEALLHRKTGWILKQLQSRSLAQHTPSLPMMNWAAGCYTDYLGQPRKVLLVGTSLVASGTPPAIVTEQGISCLRLPLPDTVASEQIQHLIQTWLMQEARRIFTERLNHFAPLLGVQYTRITLSTAQTLWGTARADGSIRLHWCLIQLPMPLIDYVVVHELSHLRHMNHSRAFWTLVHSILPDCHDRRQALKKRRPLPRLTLSSSR